MSERLYDDRVSLSSSILCPVNRVNEESPQGVLAPQVVQVPQDAQVPPQGDQVPIGDEGNDIPLVPPDITNGDIREALLTSARALTTYVTRDIESRMNALESTMTSRLRLFVRVNPPIFLGSKVGEDTEEFLNGVNKVLSAMRVTFREKAKLALYLLKDVSQLWYTQLKYYRPI